MEKRVRFTLDRDVPVTTRHARHGILDGETVFETESLWSADRGKAHSLSAVRLLPPCLPSNIVCVGRNYGAHAKELGNPVPDEPIIFLKPTSSLIGPGDAIVYPALSQSLSYEGELGVVIGRTARRVKAADAPDYILGFTCVNDVTARDLQKKDGQWARAKGFDTFCPVGPWIVPRDAVDLGAARVQTTLDGEVKQDGPVSDMLFPVPVILEYVTAFMTLEPGDLIATGTPPGVGPMLPGQRVRVEVTGIGGLENPVVRQG
jgi:2-keto-4-pentenoate hydratase/2-oxohepta-3-ene-1,7-dioic acid hydratase in catechol pathway